MAGKKKADDAKQPNTDKAQSKKVASPVTASAQTSMIESSKKAGIKKTSTPSQSSSPKLQERQAKDSDSTSPPKQPTDKKLAIFSLIIAIMALVAIVAFWYEAKISNNAEQALQNLLIQNQQNFQTKLDSLQQSQRQRQELVTEQIRQNLANIAKQRQYTDLLLDQMDELKQKIEPQRDRFIISRVHELIYQAQSVVAVSRQSASYVSDLLLEAQDLLISIVDPYWDPLRQALVKDVDSLGQASSSSAIIIYEQIEQLRRNIRSLAFNPPSNQQDRNQQQSKSDAESGLIDNLTNKLTEQLRKIVVIRQHQEGFSSQISVDSFGQIKLLIESGLSQAQLGLLQQNSAIFSASLKQVQDIIEQRLDWYQLDQQLLTINELLATDLFDAPSSLESYSVLKSLETEQR